MQVCLSDSAECTVCPLKILKCSLQVYLSDCTKCTVCPLKILTCSLQICLSDCTKCTSCPLKILTCSLQVCPEETVTKPVQTRRPRSSNRCCALIYKQTCQRFQGTKKAGLVRVGRVGAGSPLVAVALGGFFLACNDFWRMFDHSFPAGAFRFFFF